MNCSSSKQYLESVDSRSSTSLSIAGRVAVTSSQKQHFQGFASGITFFRSNSLRETSTKIIYLRHCLVRAQSWHKDRSFRGNLRPSSWRPWWVWQWERPLLFLLVYLWMEIGLLVWKSCRFKIMRMTEKSAQDSHRKDFSCSFTPFIDIWIGSKIHPARFWEPLGLTARGLYQRHFWLGQRLKLIRISSKRNVRDSRRRRFRLRVAEGKNSDRFESCFSKGGGEI